MKKILFPIILMLALSGCSVSGYGGKTTFRCSQDGSTSDPLCASISGNYNASIAGMLVDGKYRNSSEPYSVQGIRTMMGMYGYTSGTPVRSQSEVARIWIAPYLDSDGDLVDQSFTYVVLNQGKWLIEHNQQNIIDEYRPIRLLGSNGQVPAQGESNSKASSSPPDQVPDIGLKLND